jgi:hypothetical protein
MMMKFNLGKIDRAARILIGFALLVWVFAMDGPKWAWIGVVPLMNGLIGICPAYSILKFDTRRPLHEPVKHPA